MRDKKELPPLTAEAFDSMLAESALFRQVIATLEDHLRIPTKEERSRAIDTASITARKIR